MTTLKGAFSFCSCMRQPFAVRQCGSYPRQSQPGWNEPNTALCHHPRRHGRRRRRSFIYLNNGWKVSRIGPWKSMQSFVFIVLLSIALCCGSVRASDDNRDGRCLGQSAELLFDTRDPPEPPVRLKPSLETTIHDISGQVFNSDATKLEVRDEHSQLPLPRPFDSSLGQNFSAQSCPRFFNTFLSDQSFNECLPFSLLLQTSNAFFTVTQSLPQLKQTLDATCNVRFEKCASLMSSLALQIQQNYNCGADFQMRNPVVIQAYAGFLAYRPLFHAGCLKDSHGNYCFANAITNASAPTSAYVYYLPLGVHLPGGSQPACDKCLQNTMSIFATYARNSSQPLSSTYSAAAQEVDMTCGPSFVASTVQMNSSAGLAVNANGLGFLTLVLVFLQLLI